MRNLTLVAVLLSACAFGPPKPPIPPPPPPAPDVTTIPIITPRRTYVMQGIDQVQISDATLQKADGMVIRTKWSSIEPVSGSYKLDYVKAQIARCVKLGKKVYLQILSGDDAPRWLEAQGVPFTAGVPHQWNATYLARYDAMLKHVAANIDTSAITHFATIGADNSEWHYNQFGGFYSAPGISDDNMVAAHVAAAGSVVKHLPKVIAIANIGDHTRPWTAKAITALKAKYKGRIGFQMCSLKADNSPTYDGITRIKKAREEGFHVGMETVGPSVGANGQPVDRFGGPYSAAIKMANDVMGDNGVVSTYQWDLQWPQK